MNDLRYRFWPATRIGAHRPWRVPLWLPCLAYLLLPTSALAQITAEDARQSIEQAVTFLKREQRADGTWPDWPGHTGGVTALCTLALLNAGVPPDDPHIQPAINYLRGLKPGPTSTTYATALQTMALCAAQPNRDLPLIRQCANWFETTQLNAGDHKGGWSYPRAGGDNSNTQFALLALHEAARVGVDVNEQTWRRALAHWEQTQNADGSWGYQTGQPGSGSMTCAGIAAMVIVTARLNDGNATATDGRVLCCQEQPEIDSLARAIDWMGRNFSIRSNPGRGQTWLLYYLYGVERAGRLTAQRYFGQHDWYREGVDMLVRSQDNLSGFWRGVGHGENNPHVATSLALLFMAKGRRPILAAKLKHGPDDDWNNHQHDLANLTAYVESRWERDLSWQVIDPQAASVDDLLQAPVLFFNGRFSPQFSPEEIARLREYVNQGGFIFAEACCEDAGFDEGFRLLIEEMFPEQEHQLRLLPPDHPVWHIEEPVDPAHVRPLWGVDVGCRTSIIYCPEDLSCYWELARLGQTDRLSAEVRLMVAAANSIGINVMAYATNREVKYKYEIAPLADNAPQDSAERARIAIAKLRHTGGWDTAPGALEHLRNALSREAGLRISPDEPELTLGSERIFEYPLLFMHGRNDFRLSAAERDNLRQYILRGGFLLADSVCGSEAFTAAFRREMAAIFPEAPLEPVPVDHPLLTDAYGGFSLRLVTRREPERRAADAPLRADVRQVEPELEGVQLGDRYGVIFSPLDLSCALERHDSLECRGYTREDAARLAINAVLYALHE